MEWKGCLPEQIDSLDRWFVLSDDAIRRGMHSRIGEIRGRKRFIG